MSEFDLYKQKVIDAAKRLVGAGLMAATGGNISVRVDADEIIAVTPSSRDYMELNTDDICVCDFRRKLIKGKTNPSIETGMHIAVFAARPDVGAVVHTHQINVSAFSLMGESIPALFDEQVVNLGDEAAFVKYGLSGGTDLLNNITAALANKCNAYILQNHGALILAPDIEQAVRNAMIFEKTARAYYMALVSGREVSTLPKQTVEMLLMLLSGKQKAEEQRKKKAAEAKAARG